MKRFFLIICSILVGIVGTFAADIPANEDGVSKELAEFRAENYANVRYKLNFNIPSTLDKNVDGVAEVNVQLAQPLPVILDFRADENQVKYVKTNGKNCNYIVENEHIIIENTKQGANKIEIGFVSPNQSLNRREEFVYTLLVPDRARTLFPCFDQPNIKARYTLTLNVPNDWVAVANSREQTTKQMGDHHEISFIETEPLSTYLFAFVAGKFEMQSKSDGNHTVRAFYRETDPQKLSQLDDIFKEVFFSLNWLENYTGIKYPFSKYDFIILPGFQYGGMEHTGATLYNDRRMFTSANPTKDELLSRSNLITHETSHMWFGDLVTMKWFNDVWTKEVFANYFSARQIAELYPDLDGSFYFARDFTASALAQDRTEGATAIQQQLGNMHDAGLVYNNIIYCKAPVVMLKIHELVGEDSFRESIREYLTKFSYSNASWDDLIHIFAKHTNRDIASFSNVWVKERGMPMIEFEKMQNGIRVRQKGVHSRENFVWQQKFNVQVISQDLEKHEVEIEIKDTVFDIQLPFKPKFIIPNTDGRGYGVFAPDSMSMKYMAANWWDMPKDIMRLSVLMNIYENAYLGNCRPFNQILNGIEKESNQFIQLSAINYAIALCLDKTGIDRMIAERKLLSLAKNSNNNAVKLSVLRGLTKIMSSKEVIKYIYMLWEKQSNSLLSEVDYMTMAYHLAICTPTDCDRILSKQMSRITNPDRRSEFAFISRACSSSDASRDSVFRSLLIPENRQVEPWVNTTLSLLNHHTRERYSRKYIMPMLDALPDVQRTGDIFFPQNWVSNSLYYHNSPAAMKIVEDFLQKNLDLKPLLKSKVLRCYRKY